MANRKNYQVPAWFTSEREFVPPTYQAGNLGVRSAMLSMIGRMYEFVVKRPEFRNSRRAPELNGSVEGRIGSRTAVFHASPGAPAASMLMETLIASGMDEFIMFGYAGSVSEECRVGDILIPDWGVREEGTSYHYLPGSTAVRVSNDLAERISESLGPATCHRGGIWTTDAPYRDTKGKVVRYSRKGIRAVDMESTGLMAVAMSRRVKFASVVVISDELFGDRWVPDFECSEVSRASRVACKAVLKTLTGVSPRKRP
jgi:uridine phosphorylase